MVFRELDMYMVVYITVDCRLKCATDIRARARTRTRTETWTETKTNKWSSDGGPGATSTAATCPCGARLGRQHRDRVVDGMSLVSCLVLVDGWWMAGG